MAILNQDEEGKLIVEGIEKKLSQQFTNLNELPKSIWLLISLGQTMDAALQVMRSIQWPKA